jgi:hypothetical protein
MRHFSLGLAECVPWDSMESNEIKEGPDGEPTVLIDHDLAMAWTPY